MLTVKNLYYSYENVEVLKNVSFEVGKGQLCALFGPNGTGKTTLFKCITKLLDTKKRGEIFINKKNIEEMNMKEIAKLATYVAQEHKPSFPFTVKEVVLMGRTPHMGGFFGPSNADTEAAVKAMEMAGISHLAERLYTNLSGGQRQLVLIARALAQDTGVLLLDEPTSNLDFKNTVVMWNIIRNNTLKGKTTLICTHDPNHIFWFCDKVVVLGKEGTVLAEGKPSEVLSREMLREIYGDLCELKYLYGNSMVVPNTIQNAQGF
jgi:iron complex transport system ATP-binding protein